jgi:hypothetical protein
MGRAEWSADEALADIRRAAIAGLSDAAEYLGETSNRTCPIEEATLVGSMVVSVDERALRAAVSYDTPYAARQHEDMSMRHDAGRRAKWLELTFREEASAAGEIMADPLQRVLR